MRYLKTGFIIVAGILSVQALHAQKKPAQKPVITTVPKFKPPRLQTVLGNSKDSVVLTVAEALELIGKPLKVYDEKKNELAVSSYQFLYKRKAFTEEEDDVKNDNARPIPTTSISSDRFKVTPLPALWQNLIKEQLQPGEEFYFFDVIARDAKGIVMYASNLKILVR